MRCLVVILLLIGCKDSVIDEQFKIKYNLKKHTIVYRINDNCSVCIGEFISYAKRTKLNDTLNLFLVRNDLEILKLYLEQAKIDTVKNKFLYIDDKDLFSLNPYLRKYEHNKDFMFLIQNNKISEIMTLD